MTFNEDHVMECNIKRWLRCDGAWQVAQDNPHRLAAEDSQQGGLQLMKKPGQLLTRDQLKAQKVTRQTCNGCCSSSCAGICSTIYIK